MNNRRKFSIFISSTYEDLKNERPVSYTHLTLPTNSRV